ncbi:MAG TPA: peptidoglycan DD-metalloendopeptidase family protein [Eubacteriaceae bacterium]|nr:peptidoglycan DD-metalloendopeptidase family protein [Eubacteriaceae bacterium]
MKKGKHNYKSAYTFMMIPNNEDKIKTYNLPKCFFKALTYILASLLVISCFFIHSFITLKKDYAKNIKNIHSLEIINDKQKLQIDELKKYTQDIKEKINHLNELEKEVKSLVGLEAENDKDIKEISHAQTQEDKSIRNISRGSLFQRKPDKSSEYDQSNTLMEIKINLNKIEESLSIEENNFNSLKTDVVDQLNYLAARPTQWPNRGRITSTFGIRKAPKRGASTFHKGVDIANSYGSIIKAAGKGKVAYAGWRSGLGYTVIISHGYGFTTLYGHNSSLLVKAGQQVEKGQPIAKLGNSGNSTGPHVHFEIRVNDNPVDPMKYLGK